MMEGKLWLRLVAGFSCLVLAAALLGAAVYLHNNPEKLANYALAMIILVGPGMALLLLGWFNLVRTGWIRVHSETQRIGIFTSWQRFRSRPRVIQFQAVREVNVFEHPEKGQRVALYTVELGLKNGSYVRLDSSYELGEAETFAADLAQRIGCEVKKGPAPKDPRGPFIQLVGLGAPCLAIGMASLFLGYIPLGMSSIKISVESHGMLVWILAGTLSIVGAVLVGYGGHGWYKLGRNR